MKVNLIILAMLFSNCGQKQAAGKLDVGLGVDLVQIPENAAAYKMGLIVRLRLTNRTGGSCYFLEPEIRVWKVDGKGKLQRVDYLRRFHHLAPEYEFRMYQDSDIQKLDSNSLSVRLVRSIRGENHMPRDTMEANIYSGLDVQSHLLASSLIFTRGSESRDITAGITYLQHEKGQYRIVAYESGKMPDWFKDIGRLPASFEGYRHCIDEIVSDTLYLNIR